MNFLRRNLVRRVSTATTSASTAFNADTMLDMLGFDGVVFMARFNATSTDSWLLAQAGTASTAVSDLAGTAVELTEVSAMLEIVKPLHRYIRARVVRATATTIGDIWAIQYRGSKWPEAATATGTINAKVVISPATGTASA